MVRIYRWTRQSNRYVVYCHPSASQVQIAMKLSENPQRIKSMLYFLCQFVRTSHELKKILVTFAAYVIYAFIRKMRGPRTEPCGAPILKHLRFIKTSTRYDLCVHSLRYGLRIRNVCPEKPQSLHFDQGTLSNHIKGITDLNKILNRAYYCSQI